MSELDEVLGEFLVESYENLDRLDQDLVALEDDPTNRQLLGGIFRTIHTIKGTCGFLGFQKLEQVTHAGENLLSKLRDGELVLNESRTTALLVMVDVVRQMLASIESTQAEGDGDYSELTAHLHALGEDDAASNVDEPAHEEDVETAVMTEESKVVSASDSFTYEASPFPEEHPQSNDEEVSMSEDHGSNHEADASDQSAPTPVASEPDKKHKNAVVFGASSAQQEETVQPPASGATNTAVHQQSHQNAVDTTIRVDVALLDTLMNLVGELVLARNQIVQVTGSYGESDLAAAAQRLNLITTELQEGVMKTRMQPIGNVLSKFPRVVRDIAQQLGKHVRIDLEGKDTELDKTVNEAIKDPLTHLVRNSVDHGIESPDTRTAAGKSPEGHVVLRAFHEGGQVNIEIEDDGAGIDAEKLKTKAVEKGLVSAAHAERMSEREALNLIFLAGFSTAETVSNISGRGVGMDVVKTNIESIGGTIDIHTVLGRGTTFKIKIPLTLAIIPALLVSADQDRYAIPQVSLLELLRLEGDQVQSSIEMIHGAPVYRLRGTLLPLCHLGHELSDNALEPWHGPSPTQRVANIVVLQADGRQFGLVVDEINDTQEIVVKPLDQQLKGISAFAGATTMGDGRVALILDVLGLAQKAHVISETRDKALAEAEEAARNADFDATETLLLVQVGDRRVAVPLSLVARLEEFDRQLIENANGRSVVQYRGDIMPLVNVAYSLGAGPGEHANDSAPLRVVVYTSQDRSMGLIVNDIVDIVDEIVQVGDAQPGTGVRGSIVIQEKVTDVVDVVELIRAIDPTFFMQSKSTNEAKAGAK